MKIKSPVRFIVSIIVLLFIIYIGFTAAVSLAGNKKVNFAFWSKEKNIKSQAVENFVVAGVDEEGLRTDLILLCQYNDITKKINVLQIPRDTKVDTKRNDKKINSAYGTKERETALFRDIKNITGIEPDKYVIISFKAFRELVDAIGGVEVEVPFRMYYHDPVQSLTIDLLPGKQLLDGSHAEMFMRFRQNDDGSGYKNGDIDRIAAQKKFYGLVADKLLNVKNVFKTHKMMQIFKENVKMNFNGEEILSYLGKIPSLNKENINIVSLPGEGKYIGKVSYFVADEKKTKELMNEYFSADKDLVNYKLVNPAKNSFIKVEVVNASSIDKDMVNVAEVVSKNLENHGFNVVSSYNSDRIKDKSELVDHNAKYASDEIKKIYSSLPVKNDENDKAEVDVTLYIGNDFTF